MFPPLQGRLGWAVERPVMKVRVQEEPHMLELSCTNEEKIRVIVNPVTPAGHPIAIDGKVAASVQAGDGSVVLEDDGKSFTIVSGDNPGDTSVLVSADADLGEGVETISDLVILHVAGAKAKSLGLTAGSPELK